MIKSKRSQKGVHAFTGRVVHSLKIVEVIIKVPVPASLSQCVERCMLWNGAGESLSEPDDSI